MFVNLGDAFVAALHVTNMRGSFSSQVRRSGLASHNQPLGVPHCHTPYQESQSQSLHRTHAINFRQFDK
jgi:hypothetical protein